MVISLKEIEKMLKGFSDEQIEEMAYQFSNSLASQTFRSRRVTYDLLGIVRTELERRIKEKKK